MDDFPEIVDDPLEVEYVLTIGYRDGKVIVIGEHANSPVKFFTQGSTITNALRSAGQHIGTIEKFHDGMQSNQVH